MKKEQKAELIQGTLDMMILRVLGEELQHGWGLAQKIHLLSEDVLKVEEGSLYPALYRMERKGWIKAEWGVSENNRRAKFYKVTSTGKKRYESERENWIQLAEATALVLGFRWNK